MKFTIKPGLLIKMVEMLGEWVPGHKRAGASLRLEACQGRVCVESDEKVGETEAVIWEEGQCSLSRAQLLNALKKHRGDVELTIEANEHGLHIGGFLVLVSSFSPRAVLPSTFQMFLATDLDVISRGAARADLP